MTLYSLYIHFICDICEIAPPSVLWEPMENPPITFSWFRHSTFATAGEGQLGRGCPSTHFGAAWAQLRCACLNQQLQYRNSRELDMSDMLPMKSNGTNNIWAM